MKKTPNIITDVADYGFKGSKVASSQDCYKLLKSIYPSLDHVEFFYTMFLNRANKIIGFYMVSKGGYAGTVVDPKVIFEQALLCRASSIIVSHNHPSGNITPSTADDKQTKKLQECGIFMDMPILDHLIISESEYYSYADEGKL